MLVLVVVAAGLLLLIAGQHLTFFFDEWTFVTTRRGGGVSSWLDPHNGHLVLFPVLIYKLLFAVFGLRHYTPYRIVGIALHLTCGVLLYVLIRPRLGAWLALIPTTLLLFMGSAYQDLLWPFQMSYLASLAGGLAALALIERHSRRADALAAAMLLWSVASSGVGIPMLLSCALALAWRPEDRRRLWVVGVPAVLYGIWYVGWATGQHVTSDGVLATPGYVANAAAGTAAGIAGLTASWGPPLAVGALGAIGYAWQRRRGASVTPILLASAGGLLAFWVLAALSRSDSPDPAASRYLYVGAVFLWLLVAEVGVGGVRQRSWIASLLLVSLGALVANLGILRSNERVWRSYDASVRASLTAVEIAAPVVSPAFEPSPAYAPQLTAGPYLAAVRDLGSPAYTVRQLLTAPSSIRAQADQVLSHAERLSVASLHGAEPCLAVTVSGTVAAVPGTSLLVAVAGRYPVSVFVRRFGSRPVPLAAVAGPRTWILHLPADHAQQVYWRILLAAPGPVRACDS